MPSAVCKLLHPHLHRGVGRQIPACHDRPRWHQRCGPWHQIISTLKPINLCSFPPGRRHPWRMPWPCNLYWRRCPGRSAHCKVSTFYSISIIFLDVIASPSTYPCQSVGQWVIVSDLEISISSPSFASLFWIPPSRRISTGKHSHCNVT